MYYLTYKKMLFLCLTQTNVKILNRNKKCVFVTDADVCKAGNAQVRFFY